MKKKESEAGHDTKDYCKKEGDSRAPKELLAIDRALLYLFADKTGIGQLIIVFICSRCRMIPLTKNITYIIV